MKTDHAYYKVGTVAAWYVGFWILTTSTLGALALLRWSLRMVGWLP